MKELYKNMKYINRNFINKEKIIYKYSLSCYPYFNEAMKAYINFLKDNPQYTIENTKTNIEEEEREEDYYGNGGGVDRYLIVYTESEETIDERNDRINKLEDKAIDTIVKKLHIVISESKFEFGKFSKRMNEQIIQLFEKKLNEVTINSD